MKNRLGIYLFNGAEVIDWAGPAGVFAVARRMDPELDALTALKAVRADLGRVHLPTGLG